MKRLEQLRNQELECRDYNEVLKELALQQIEFDLDDGVDVNAKFEGAVAKIGCWQKPILKQLVILSDGINKH